MEIPCSVQAFISSPQPGSVLSKPVIYLESDISKILMNFRVLLRVIWQPRILSKKKENKRESERVRSTIAVCPGSSPSTPLLLRD